MIRNWVKNLCNYIDNLNVSVSDRAGNPTVNNKTLEIVHDWCSAEETNYILYIGCDSKQDFSKVKLEKVEYTLLKDSMESFRDRVNEHRVTEFLTPFINGVPEKI